MKGLRQHPFRVAGRLVWFGFEVLEAMLVFLLRCTFCPKNSRRAKRALWLQRTARHVGRIFQLEIQSAGTIPAHGLLICNHVSYVDILVFVSLAPAVFVAKREVKSWPVMGLLAQLGGTVFIDRKRRTHVGEVNDEIQNALADGAQEVLFLAVRQGESATAKLRQNRRANENVAAAVRIQPILRTPISFGFHGLGNDIRIKQDHLKNPEADVRCRRAAG